ncbi:MFS transporter [Croceicoccus sp. YJ47]|uniref:spinster family MFS transporter n=1 Tax=Croceicoccus sp. YJ47 TaxID=2798724 RepID=UPI0019216B60|nr:MFS transporter [Croceicoccus sp. YJ47]QQN74391.1 MFS transporter [Croceicoccus sp. YJ47]
MKFGKISREHPSTAYRNYVLGVFSLIYALNFIDRQIISVLALDLKRDLGLSDADLGFLYGTAFGVFYALFGIPMGRLADSWNRIRLVTIGFAFWSLMTTLSGFARTGVQLTLARIGVGVGEATASPCAYSLISDYFPKNRRATAIALYTAGMYIGSGASLFIGAKIVEVWNDAFPEGWQGIVGWQAAFMAVGLPGLALACLVATLREPVRGLSDGIEQPPVERPFRGFLDELLTMVPPFCLFTAARRGRGPLLVNIAAATLISLIALGLIAWTGDKLQWVAVGIGVYAIFSWVAALKSRDRPAWTLIWKTPSFLYLTIGHGLTSFVNYAVIFWSLPYVESELGADRAEAAFFIGGAGAVAGFVGLIFGGRFADFLRERHPSGRVMVMIAGAILPFVPLTVIFTTGSLGVFYVLYFPMILFGSITLPSAGATSQDLVLPRMRGLASATFLLSLTMIGLALGPYSVGAISSATGSMSTAILSLMAVLPVSILMFVLLYLRLPKAEETLVERARQAGEQL